MPSSARAKRAVNRPRRLRLGTLMILLAILPPVLAVAGGHSGTDRLAYLDAVLASAAFLSLGYHLGRLVERLRRPSQKNVTPP